MDVLLFFALTYAVTWASFFGAVTLSTESWLVSPLLVVGTFAPSVVALGLITRETGLPGIRTLLQRVVDLRASWQWYVFAVGYIAALKLLTALTYRMVTASWPAFGTTPLVVIPFAILISTPVQHPPLFFVPGHANYGQPFWFFVLGSTALSVAMTWLYVNTGGSVGLAMLMHSAVNQTNGIVPTRLASPGDPLKTINGSLVVWLFGAFLWSTAAYFLMRLRRTRKPESLSGLSG